VILRQILALRAEPTLAQVRLIAVEGRKMHADADRATKTYAEMEAEILAEAASMPLKTRSLERGVATT
jgi:hypothetical protein